MVLADYHLDDGTGIEAVKELRWKFGAGLPAVLVTADRSVEMQERAEAAGIAILNKPVKPAALRAMVAQFRAVPEAAE
jgi:CheY-like chemotaxis protein